MWRIEKGIIPENWNNANVPIYRHISLLSQFYKLLTRLLTKRTTKKLPITSTESCIPERLRYIKSPIDCDNIN